MMLGEVDNEQIYATGPENTVWLAQGLYIAYAFLVVILLSNVLIAIVTDSYEYIKNDKAALVFWSNRLHFVAEIDALIDGFTKNRSVDGHAAIGDSTNVTESFRYSWSKLMDLFSAYTEIDIFEFFVYSIFRILAILFIIPGWILVGVASAGILWPPQIREFLFVQKNTFQSRGEVERKKLEQLAAIQRQVDGVKQHMMREISQDQDDIIRAKAEIEKIHGDFLTDLQQVKELFSSLTA